MSLLASSRWKFTNDDPRVVNQIWGEFQRARDRFVEVGKAETRIWLVIRQGTSARFPTILRTAGFLCGQIGGHYVPKLGLNCGSGNESGCSNAHIVSSNLFPHLLTGDLSISFFFKIVIKHFCSFFFLYLQYYNYNSFHYFSRINIYRYSILWKNLKL